MKPKSLLNRLLTTLATLALSSPFALADDHGDSLGSATTITNPDTAGHLDSGDVDWFKLVITQPGRHWFYTTGSTDTWGRLYNNSGNDITPNVGPDNDGADENFYFSTILPEGTYYLSISSGTIGTLTGNYNLAIRSPQFAQNFNDHNLDDSLAVRGDRNLYRITLERDERMWIYTTGTTDTNGFLYDAAGNSVTPNTSPNNDGADHNFLFNSKYSAGIYYLMVRDGDTGLVTGDYTLSIRTLSQAQVFNTPNQASSLSVRGELDLYRIDLPVDDRVWIFTTGDTDTSASLMDDSGNTITPNTSPDDDGADDNFRFTAKLNAGTYYLLVSATSKFSGYGPLTGNYTLSLRSTHTAIPFKHHNQDHSLGILGDLDLYQITVNETGLVWIYTTGGTDTVGTLYDSSGNNETPNTSPGDDGHSHNFMMTPYLTPGHHYLLIESGAIGSQTGDYTLSVRDASRSIPLTNSGSTNGTLAPLGSLDLYTFTTTGGPVQFESTGITDTKARLYDSSGTDVTPNTSPDNDGSGKNFLFAHNLDAGRYYLLVSGQNIETVSGSYNLVSDFNAGELLHISGGGATINSSGSSFIEIVATGNWSVSNLPSWITPSQTSGSGSATLQLSYTKNLTGATREAIVTIGGQSYTVTQLPEGDTTGQPVPAQMSIAMGVLITVPTEPGVSYRVETSDDMNTWVNTGVILQGDGAPQNLAFERTEARQFYRAIPQ